MENLFKIIWFKGRINRMEYLISMLLIWLPISWIADGSFPVDILLPMLYLHFTQSVKRLQDRGRHGIWAIEPTSVIFNFTDRGEEGPNEYGPEPLDIFESQ